jgi:hypothetical protein
MSEQPVVVAAGDTAATATAAEANAEAAVAIAEAQEAGATERAQIAADAAVAVTEAAADATEDDVAWLRDELDGLRIQCATNAGALSGLEAQMVSLAAQMTEMAGALASLSTPRPLSAEPPPQPVTEPSDALASEAGGRRVSSEVQADGARIQGVPRRRWL